jgi:hypothetical protein
MGGNGIVTGVAVGGTGYSVTVTEISAREMMTAAQGVVRRSMSMREIVSTHMAMRGSKSMEPVPAPNVGKAAEPASMSAPNVSKAAASVSAATPEAAEPTSVPAPTPKPASVSAPSPKPASVSAPAATSMAAGERRDVRDKAKRANRNARCQDTYRSFHGALLDVVLTLRRLVSRPTPT